MIQDLRDRVAKDPDQILEPIFRALSATKSYAKNGQMVTVPDYDVQLKAAGFVFDRLYGKPVQALEHSGPDGNPLMVLLKLAQERGIYSRQGLPPRRPAARR